jgi:RNA polymerase sigma factor (sigma-70 family)
MLIAASAVEELNLASGGIAAVPEVTPDPNSARRQEFESILPQVLPRFRRIAARWLDNDYDAEDAIQDAMVSAFVHITQFDGRAKMSTWLSAIVVNEVRMRMRRRRRVRLLSLNYSPKDGKHAISELLADPRPSLEKTLERFELYTIVMRLIRGLAPAQRAALRVYQKNDVPLRELAKMLKIPEATMKAQLARGRAMLRERFREVVAKPKLRVLVSRRRAACPNLTAMQPMTRSMRF